VDLDEPLVGASGTPLDQPQPLTAVDQSNDAVVMRLQSLRKRVMEVAQSVAEVGQALEVGLAERFWDRGARLLVHRGLGACKYIKT
jgi:uncharacterized protein YigA (DUF484 family)